MNEKEPKDEELQAEETAESELQEVTGGSTAGTSEPLEFTPI